jgi:hypothetical protein
MSTQATLYLITDQQRPRKFFADLNQVWRLRLTKHAFGAILARHDVVNNYQSFKVEKMVVASNPHGKKRNLNSFY